MWCPECKIEYGSVEKLCPDCGAVLVDKLPEPKLGWGRASLTGITENWPKDENNELVAPAFLTHCSSLSMEDDMLVNMLSAFEIPAIKQYPVDGGFGRVVLGISGTGTDIYVPETLLSEARELINSNAEERDAEF